MTDLKQYIASQLNDEQSKAALHTNTSSLIIAGAGSWKTRTLTYKIAYLIRGLNIKPTNILAVTFTNKASNEMRERLLKIAEELQQANITPQQSSSSDQETADNKSGDSIDDFLQSIQSGTSSFASGSTNQAFALQNTALKRIGTFHSTFLKMLKEDIEKLDRKYDKNFGMYDPDETKKVITEVLKKLNLSEVFKVPEVKSFISTQKNNGLDPKWCMKNIKTDYDQSMYQVYEEYQKTLEKSNSLDFDDLLLFPYLLFKHAPEVLAKRQRKFSYILVDEAQDTNWIQFELIKMLSAQGSNVTLIGDDFQSIYGRRGAIMENFLNVKKYRPDMQMFKLQINYRSRPHIVQAGNEIIKNNPNQYEKSIVPHRQGNDKIVCFSHGSEMDEAANIVDFIKKMKDGGKLEGRWKVAILYRTNAQSSPFEQVLLQAGIPYKIWGAFKFFERKEVKDIISYLKYLLNPQDSISLKRVINTPERSVGKTSLEKLEEEAQVRDVSLQDMLVEVAEGKFPLTGKAKTGITNFIQTTQNARLQLKDHTPSQCIAQLVKAIHYRDYLIKEEGGEAQADEKYENIGQVINMAEKYIDLGEEALRQFMEEVTLLSDISENEEGSLDAIKLMTVHSSKWLEFPLVFIVGLEDSVFPLANSLMEPKLLEEERRLMYVAITRAQDHVFISHAHSRLTRGQTKMNPPSRFIGELPADLLKKYDLGWSVQEEELIDVNEGDSVKHKLFGTGYVLEVRNKLAIVKFHNPKFGVRKIELKFLEVI